MVISRLDQTAASVSVVVRGSCNVTVNVCGVHFSVVSDGVPGAPPDTGRMIVQDDSDSGDMAADAMNDPVAAMQRSHKDGTENGLPMPRLSCQSSAAFSRKSCGDSAVSALSSDVETDRQTVTPNSDVLQFETESEAEGMVITEKTDGQAVQRAWTIVLVGALRVPCSISRTSNSRLGWRLG